MSIEKQNSDPADELRRLILGDVLATPTDLENLEALAYAAVESAPVSRILEVNYSVSPGYLGFMLVEESDTVNGTSPATVVTVHAGETDDPYISLCYDSNNTLCETIMSGKRSTTENVFHAVGILHEILTGDELGQVSEDEEAVINKIMSFLNTIEGVKEDRVHANSATIHFTDIVSRIVENKCSAIQHTREINGDIGNGQEISIVTAKYEKVDDAEELSPEEQYPLIQINLQDRNTRMLSYYLGLATGERVCDTAPLSDDHTEELSEFYISDDDDSIKVQADDIIANSMSGLNREIIDSLSSAIVQLSLMNEFEN